jgi:hypothetical protein
MTGLLVGMTGILLGNAAAYNIAIGVSIGLAGSLTERRLASPADVEAAIEKALAHGNFYFADIQHNRVDQAGLAVLGRLAAGGENAILSCEDLAGQSVRPGDLDQALTQLIRRELVEAVDGGFVFKWS